MSISVYVLHVCAGSAADGSITSSMEMGGETSTELRSGGGTKTRPAGSSGWTSPGWGMMLRRARRPPGLRASVTVVVSTLARRPHSSTRSSMVDAILAFCMLRVWATQP
jgi:hypothetical protein